MDSHRRLFEREHFGEEGYFVIFFLKVFYDRDPSRVTPQIIIPFKMGATTGGPIYFHIQWIKLNLVNIVKNKIMSSSSEYLSELFTTIPTEE